MIEDLREFVVDKRHTVHRQQLDVNEGETLTRGFAEAGLSDVERAARRLTWMLEHEQPVILEGERIAFTKTVTLLPELHTPEEWEAIRANHSIHELGRVCNICSDFASTIELGLARRREEAVESRERHQIAGDSEAVALVDAIIRGIDDVEKLVHRYAIEALRCGREDLYDLLRRVPMQGATTFHEALQSLRVLHFTLWAAGNYHNTLGRFDQYMLPYLRRDMEAGRLDRSAALTLIEEFFINCNKDSDLYPGMQQGDNGQSLVLGGCDAEGKDCFNELSELCLEASLNLRLIDPKINLRLTHETGMETYDQATLLTRQGLGFPQYSNDDVVIRGLIEQGYAPSDARNYVVAACWEYIIPGCGMDIPNIAALSFIRVVEQTLHSELEQCGSFDELIIHVDRKIACELERIAESVKNLYMEPSPFQSLLMNGCVESGRDISLGNRYNHYGIHGTGIATAVDSLAAVKRFVFEEQSVSAPHLLEALRSNFESDPQLWERLRYEAPKFGNDDDFVDSIAVDLLNRFYEHARTLRNERGGSFRAGSGSAMYYLWHSDEVGATPDGRKRGEPLSANYSPSLNVKLNGPISILSSFAKPDMSKIINGGPLTLELHDTVFRNEDSIRKVSSLVKAYRDRGGQQLQINAVNRDRLIAAKKHPEQHKNLIVRVWGWSGYFVELDEAYQDHIIQRVELQL